MKLLSSLLSPYVRKVRIAADMKGLGGDIELVPIDTNIPSNAQINRANPLAKIPTLIVNGSSIFDSHVICEYLDSQAASPVLFPSGPERIKTLTLGALGDGMLEAALLLVYEKRFRPEEKWHQPWQQRQQDKIDRALDFLEHRSSGVAAQPRLWTHHARLCSGLSRLSPRRQMASRSSHARGLARRLRQGRAGLRGNAARGLAGLRACGLARRRHARLARVTWPGSLGQSGVALGRGWRKTDGHHLASLDF